MVAEKEVHMVRVMHIAYDKIKCVLTWMVRHWKPLLILLVLSPFFYFYHMFFTEDILRTAAGNVLDMTNGVIHTGGYLNLSVKGQKVQVDHVTYGETEYPVYSIGVNGTRYYTTYAELDDNGNAVGAYFWPTFTYIRYATDIYDEKYGTLTGIYSADDEIVYVTFEDDGITVSDIQMVELDFTERYASELPAFVRIFKRCPSWNKASDPLEQIRQEATQLWSEENTAQCAKGVQS